MQLLLQGQQVTLKDLLISVLLNWYQLFVFRAEGGMRRGNMGHLTRIANAVVQNMEKGPMQTQISEFIKGTCSISCSVLYFVCF